MKRFLIPTALGAAALLAACATSSNTNVSVKPASSPVVVKAEPHPEDDAPRISLADAKKDFDEKAAVFIDTHPANQYELEHIPGAINILPNEIKQNLDKVPRGKKIIVYCS